MAKLRETQLNSWSCKTVYIVALVCIGCVLAHELEKDFEFTDSEVKLVKRAVNSGPSLISDDEDLLADDVGSGPDEGSATDEPPFTKTVVAGYPVFYRVTIAFTSIAYTSGLGDRNSADFQDLSAALAGAIEQLFTNVPGQQMVTVIQYSRDPLLVTLDLVSDGFNDQQVLRSVLENSIGRGSIGPYGVSREGFSFKSLQPEATGRDRCSSHQFHCDHGVCIDSVRRCDQRVDCPGGADERACHDRSCPTYIGRKPDFLPRNGSNWASLLINNAFPCPGRVVSWEYYRLIPEGEAFAGVWRQVTETEFLLVDRTLFPPAAAGRQTVSVTRPIEVQRGDFIGIFYPRSTRNNVIAQATLADDAVPASELFQNYYAQFYEDMLEPEVPFDVSTVPSRTTNATFAIRAVLDYASPLAVIPVYTCASNEFTCNDGYCIQKSYVCDRQPDCNDGSDELNCGPDVEPCLEGRIRCVSTGQCINRRLRCDGKADCPDGSDEQFCTACTADEYRCIDGSCISILLRCDSRADCPGGDDEFQCQSIPCRGDEFRCEGGLCINAVLRCDGNIDCPDRTDELDCPPRQCRIDEFRCDDGSCIPGSKECDSLPDCVDASDEDPNRCTDFGELCPEGLYRCDDGKCVNPLLRCDGKSDCDDGSDEKGCVTPDTTTSEIIPFPELCPEGLFRCNSGQCIRPDQKCDGRRDCQDNSDEIDCVGCESGDFQCNDGSCIDGRLQCDGISDCKDASDEAGCPVLKITGTARVEEGQTIRVMCNLTGGDPSRHTISWLVDGESVSTDENENIDIQNFPMPEKGFLLSQLHIKQSTALDTAIYSCSGPGNLQADFSVEVVARGCRSSEFSCSDGQCIASQRRCDRRLDCEDGSDEENCPPRTCGPRDFTCRDGQCIDAFARCNKAFDCADRSDEEGCPCEEDEFTCTDGRCISSSRRCNREIDCSDGSDEKGCACNSAEFRCRNGQCIAGQRYCDGRPDCMDGSDEDVCQPSCRTDQFQCGSGECVDRRRLCDGRTDCRDLSDERSCPTSPTLTCLPGQFTCQNKQCIDAGFRCDGHIDCEDKSDEAKCPCRQNEFTCVTDRRCISTSLVCNGISECQDGSDEIDCGCRADEFTCVSNNRCIPSSRRCDRRADCEDRSDEENCPCLSEEFTCVSSGRCIPASRVCDRRRDCPDNSDEQNCACQADEFTCESSNRCIPSENRCDQRNDCEDGSDERNCPCRADQFTCESSRRCISRSQVCNRRNDCEDGSDERNCRPICRPGEFACVSDGRCLPPQYVCNRRADCRDGSDEANCPCDEEVEFRCGDGRCIPTAYRCNGQADCVDRSDEANCPSRVELVITPASLRVRAGQTAIFLCQASGVGSTGLRLSWSRPGALGLPSSAVDDSRGRITLRNVAREDAGDYICSAVGVSGTFQSTVRLEVDYIGPTLQPPTTLTPPDGRCQPDEATCSNGQCIPRDYLCDGEQDCSDSTDELSCGNPLPCEPNEFLCNNGRCAMKIWRCDGDNDCGDGSDESNCPTREPGAACRTDQFMCQRGDQCVPSSYQCDGEMDCQDRSDEIGCVVPTIIKPPVPEIDVELNGTFTIYCEAVGVPTPLIVWRQNWGNIPSGDRVTVTSVGGRGTLVVKFARIEDAGAYTCEALNNRGSIFATPDAMVIVRRTAGACLPPRFNLAALNQDECVRCFCFGHTETCYSSNLQISQITLGNQLQLVRRTTLQPVEEGFVRYIPSSGEFLVQDLSRTLPSDTYYWSLPRQYLGNRLTSYGGDLSYRVYYEVDGYDIPTNNPDVILEGNGIYLIHRHDPRVPPRSSTTVRVPLVENAWEKGEGSIRGDVPISQYATRQDLMLALQNVTRILVRATYDTRQTQIRIGDILLTTAVSQNTGFGRAIKVEDCSCPTGYSGLSCESCASGFYRIQRGRYLGECVACNCNGHSNDCDPETGVCLECRDNTAGLFCERCAEGFIGDARRGTPIDCEPCPCPLTVSTNQFSRTCVYGVDGQITCTACPPGYNGRRCERCAEGYRGNPLVPGDRCTLVNATDLCDTRGSLTTVPSPTTGRCDCKPNVQGQLCDQCRPETFYLSEEYSLGCVPCFCMGVTQMCQSTFWNRAQVGITFSSESSGVTLTNIMKTRSVETGFLVDRGTRELTYRRFTGLPRDVYYWNLPARFLGNKVTAYGGNLRFTVRYRPGQDSSPISLGEPIVEIGGNDITLVYRGTRQVPPNKQESFSITLYESNWLRVDGGSASREHLLMALADLEFVLIRATYTQTTEEAALSDVSLDIADDRVASENRAFAVEQCNCPAGYRGLSCEDCDTGYTRSGGGLYLGLCEPCNCNKHSSECDPETGVCRNCRHNTEGEKCERCLPGYYGDATRSSVNDCLKCPCPLTESPNQFSPTCILAPDRQVTCTACPVGHTGRRCESCLPGYEGNPLQPGSFCKPIVDRCDCDTRGTVPNTQCDPVTGQCQCKAYVQGLRCSACRDGYFYLDESNQQGCLNCFCMGITTQCSSSTYSRDVIRPQFNADGTHAFSFTNRRLSRTITDGFTIDAARNEIIFNNFQGIQRERESLFFQLPPKFRGDKVTSYGGYLRFTLTYSTSAVAGQGYMDVDVEIISKDQRMYLLLNPSPKPQVTQDYRILLRESSFRLLDGSTPTREALLTILADIDAILIRATYNSQMSSVSLRNLEMDVAVPRITGLPPAPEVESCRCPEGYTGLSCQECAPGFLRVPDSGTALGRCTRCNCNGHASTCDPVTGQCLDCRDNTEGERCERCIAGYYGDPTAGTPNDCRPCPCPLTIPSNQFSRTCFLDQDRQVTCEQCPQGYTGRNCEKCAEGYSGNPGEVGGRCVFESDPLRPTVIVNPIQLQERVGSLARFQCQVTGRGPFNVVWSRLDGRRLPPSATTGVGPTYDLVLSRLDYTDAGRYVCSVTNAYGTSRGIVELTVERIDQPLRVMIEEPRQIQTTVGANVRLVCVAISYSSEANYVLSWSKDGGNLPARAIDQNGVLYIPNIQPEDAGQYTCTGSDPNSVDRATATIRIERIDESPSARIEPRYLQVTEGSPVEFKCTATGVPAPVVRWTRGRDGPLPDYAVVSEGIFRIPSVRKADEAEYYCTATNRAGTGSTRTIIYVTPREPGRLEIHLRLAQITATVGSNVQLECYTKGNADVQLIWSRQGGLPPGSSQDGGILTVPNIQPSYAGNYVCTGTDQSGSIGTATAVVTVIPRESYEAPTARVEPETQTVAQGTTGTLRCIVTGSPRPTITWSRVPGTLTLNHNVQGEILRITQATMEDRGVYICSVSNVAGRAQASGIVEIERREIPRIEVFPQDAQTIAKGASVLFQCRVVGGIPAPTVTWSRVGLKPFTQTTEVTDENGVIMFKRVTGDEQGGYICTATNAMGTVTATVNLRIEGPPVITITPGHRITAIVGQRVDLECIGEGEPVPTVFWRAPVPRRGDIVPDVAITDPLPGTASLTFERVSETDGGSYICVARNSYGVVEESVDLSVVQGEDQTGVSPAVDIEGPDRLSLKEGDSVQLTCTATGLRSPLIRWRRPGGLPLPPGHSVSGGQLYIPRITAEYQGEYQCIVTSERGDYSSSVILIVSVTPRLRVSPSQVTARVGQSITLNCHPEGAGPFQLEWQKIDGVISPSVREIDGRLEIRQVTAADAGRYRCVATSDVGVSEGFVTISVQVPPSASVTPKRSEQAVGGKAEFQCEVSGDPRPEIRWEKEGGLLPPQHQIRNGLLILYNLVAEDAGRYICTATSESGTVRDFVVLRVNAAPDIGSTLGRSVQTVDEGDRVEFECIVTGTPRPTVSWSKLEGPLPATASVGDGILIIPEARPEDAGTYRCTAANVAGSVQSQVQLFVQSRPVISALQDLQTAALGSPTTLSCEAQGSPQPTITWIKKDGDLPMEHSITETGGLYIPRVREEDSGTYECQASNRYGTTQVPVILIVGALVPYFPQNPNSYMSFAPLPDVYLDLDILLSFRPESTDGLLLYNGQHTQTNGDFVCFGLSGAIPEFRFDVGSGPAIIRGKNPLELNKWHTVHLRREKKNGTLLVNDEPPYFGEAPGRFVGMDIEKPLYIGGVPNYEEVPRAAGFTSGFVGSVSQVQLKGVPLNLGAQAIEVYGIEQYDACRDSPCYNEGRCQPYNNAYGFRCLCAQGFTGLQCEIKGEQCYPGACGQGRCYDLPDSSGFLCICPAGFSGVGCSVGLVVVDPAFNKTSFISYPTIQDGILSVSLEVVFKPRSLDDGIVLYNAQNEDGRGDFVAIIIKDGFVEFRFDTGSGPAILRSRNKIPVNEWATVRAERKGRDGMLIVNNEDQVNEQVDPYYNPYSRRDRGDIARGTSPGNTIGLNLKRPLYLGGVDPSEAISSNVGTREGFVGCIAQLKVGSKEIDLLADATESVNIQDCGDRSVCDRDPCQNDGVCQEVSLTEYICHCHQTFTGRNCELEIDECITREPCQNGGTCSVVEGHYICSCPLGFMGRDCETEITIGDSFELSGDGYVELDRAVLSHHQRQLKQTISFTIKTVEPNGLLFWQGQPPGEQRGGNDYLTIFLRNGFVEFRFELGSGPAVLTSTVPVDDGFPHTVVVERLQRSANLTVNNAPTVTGSSKGPLQVINVLGNIFFGGVPDLQHFTDGQISSNFNGCISDIRIMNRPPLEVSKDAISGANVRPCVN
ncbi:basement membrane-specific heparan sulfate proteoglycan core protein-like isoform X8 [Pomacea canaliculata]|uniref:basement membrane-specific heparan sulfate proteoglycan core protein-like isoform X8 n=1 Tax=Pomacea canaliculata TaxID=400727 RepID=UPI000D73987D|nr:basement membrane-specific heparan sulfate proteoglycan core protein-like isoform X8 [Pomacea canaliculata]